MVEAAELLLRADSAGLCHDLLDYLHDGRIRFSVGMDMTEDVRQAVSEIADGDWVQAISADGEERGRAFVAELELDLSGWPEGARAICRRERAHPGAQLSLIDTDGWRHQVFMTDQQGEDIARLDLAHRGHARVEDRIRCAKQTGLENLPFRDFALNEVWLELSLAAQDLIAWTKALLLEGELARAEPKGATGSSTRPAASPAQGGRPGCGSSAPGPGQRRLWRRSSASGRCPPRRRPERPGAAPTDHHRAEQPASPSA